MNKKGQAAMEFLMTYGWAILAAIIAIGVLAYFGVFNPSNLASSTAALNPPLNVPVGGFNIVSDDVTNCGGNDCINMEITQNLGQSIEVSSATITLTSGGQGTCTNTTAVSTWTSGTPKTIHFDCGDVFNSGDSVAGSIAIDYNVAGGAIGQKSTGTVRGVAQ